MSKLDIACSLLGVYGNVTLYSISARKRKDSERSEPKSEPGGVGAPLPCGDLGAAGSVGEGPTTCGSEF